MEARVNCFWPRIRLKSSSWKLVTENAKAQRQTSSRREVSTVTRNLMEAKGFGSRIPLSLLAVFARFQDNRIVVSAVEIRLALNKQ